MICAEFFMKGKMPVGFRITGHSGFSETGTDIVCAAVSSAAYLTANTVTDILHVSAEVSVKDGSMALHIPEKSAAACSVLLRGFRLHMSALQQQYPENITLTDTEV
jgi:uncharacterized protein YsxB (DUF464 family)